MPNKQSHKLNNVTSLDKKSGSLAYNRFEMQISQTIHMAIELYSNLNYLLVLDHYDDITLFDDDVTPETVSYYQMKTSEDSISINTAISEEWVAKLYEQLNNSQWMIKELGLITNCPPKSIRKIQERRWKNTFRGKKIHRRANAISVV
ncbi:MAG: dsDNA nuclease domain-containing protein [Oscillospiraceae bacterium]